MHRLFVALSLSILSVACAQPKLRVELRQIGSFTDIFIGDSLIQRTGAKVYDVQELSHGERWDGIVWQERSALGSRSLYSVFSPSSGWQVARPSDLVIRLKDGRISAAAEGSLRSGLALVQLKTQPMPSYLQSIKAEGVTLINYLHGQSYLVRGQQDQLERLRSLPYVQAVLPFAPEHKLSAELRMDTLPEELLLLIVPTEVHAVAEVLKQIKLLGGKVQRSSSAGMTVEAELASGQLAALIASDSVAWVEAQAAIGTDMDLVRVQVGVDYLSTLPDLPPHGYTGIGIRGHLMEGIDPKHPDFAATEFRQAPIAVDNPLQTAHGQSSFGIIFGSGAGNPKARGILPNAQGFYTNYDDVFEREPEDQEAGTRYELVSRLVNDYHVMFQSASWGHGRSLDYNARSAELDRIIFDHNLPITQSQSNGCSQESRPEAWAKNVISVGAVYAFENTDPSDDRWRGDAFGCGSIGPAQDGRIKPDLVANYDDTFTTTLGNDYVNFGGTSGATPIVAGTLGLALEMYTNGLFAPLKVPNGDRFANRPRFTTAKALLINGAKQYSFSGREHDLTRMHQGWGHPNVRSLYDSRNKMLVIDEDFVLQNLETYVVTARVEAGEPELKLTMTYADPVGNLAATKQLVNNLNLRVTAPDGTVYWGNYGLNDGPYSLPGGMPDDIDTVENVIIKDPAPGDWLVEVFAAELVADSYLPSSAIDTRFALVVTGISRK